jgi:hypothetical protein
MKSEGQPQSFISLRDYLRGKFPEIRTQLTVSSLKNRFNKLLR